VVQKYRCTNDMCAAEFRSLDVDKLEINFDTWVDGWVPRVWVHGWMGLWMGPV